MSLSRFCLVVLILLLALPLAAQTTGSLTGKVTDSSGAGIPGVTIEAKSASLQGVRTAMTDSEGLYRFSLLPPGQYSISFKLEGFAEVHRNVTVSLAQDAAIDTTLKASAQEEITVTAAAPVLDTSTSSLGTNLNARAIETLPTGRNYSSIVQVAPGVSSDANPGNQEQSTISVYGSSGAENSFFVDGVNTTNAEYGFQGKELNFEFISEVNVKTGGYEAEFGRSTGGIINVITKSGGNELRGDVFGYYDNDSLQSNAKSVVSNAGTNQGFTRKDYGADLGGYLIKDKLWFFGAYDQVRNSIDSGLPAGPHEGDIVTSESHRNLGSAKLTWNVTTGHSLVATFLQDPRVDTGAINDNNHTLNGDASTYLGRQDFGGRDYAIRYDGGFASQWILSGQIARHREKNSVGPATAAGEAIQYRDAANDFFQTGGFGLEQDKTFDRKLYGTSLERFYGAHDIKGGFDYQTQTAEVTKQMSGGQQVDVLANETHPSKPIYRHFYWTTPSATVANAPVGALNAKPEHRNTALFLQDRWSMQNVTINAGVRWDRQRIIDSAGVTQIDLKKDYAPRLGFTWDPSGTHSAKLFGSYGRYYEEIPMDLVIRSFSYERQPRIFNYSPTSTVPDPAAEADLGSDTHSAILGGFTEPSDPDLRNQYLSEYIIGGEREVRPNLSVGVKGIYRKYGRVIEDFLCADDGTYCIGNPGEGIMKEVFTLDYSHTEVAPKPKRTYKGVQFDATKRFSNNWQAIASYVYSKLDGNYDGEYAPFTNVGADPNISAAYDYFDFFTNGSDLTKITNKGPLSNDRKHQFKVSGVYETPWKVSLGASAYWRSGTPLTRYGYSDAYGRYEFFLTNRGSEGRTPDNYEADVHVGYPIETGRLRINVLLDIFNILNAQRPVLLDQRWGFEEADNASPIPVNTNYGKPILRTPPTSARVGVRLSF
jgi:Carboxypeptidase regulatory-like domain/TonB-dependent Receptor Plug Domain